MLSTVTIDYHGFCSLVAINSVVVIGSIVVIDLVDSTFEIYRCDLINSTLFSATVDVDSNIANETIESIVAFDSNVAMDSIVAVVSFLEINTIVAINLIVALDSIIAIDSTIVIDPTVGSYLINSIVCFEAVIAIDANIVIDITCYRLDPIMSEAQCNRLRIFYPPPDSFQNTEPLLRNLYQNHL